MPEQVIRVAETIYYDVRIKADSREEAVRLFENHEFHADLDIVEVDTTELEVCND